MLCSEILQTNLIKRILYWDVLPLLFQVSLSAPLDIGIAMGQASIAPTVYRTKSQMCHSPRRRLLKTKVQQLHAPEHCPTAQDALIRCCQGHVHISSSLGTTLQTRVGKATAASERNSPQHLPCTGEVWVVRESVPCEMEEDEKTKGSAETSSLASFKHQ